MIQPGRYRDAGLCPVPIARFPSELTVRFEPAPLPSSERQARTLGGELAARLYVASEKGLSIRQGARYTDEELSYATIVAEGADLTRRILTPEPTVTAACAARTCGGRLLSRLWSAPGADRELALAAVSLGGGFYRAAPGYPVLGGVYVGGSRFRERVLYDAHTGIVYLERASGAPVIEPSVMIVVNSRVVSYRTPPVGSFFATERGVMQEGSVLLGSGEASVGEGIEDVRRVARAADPYLMHTPEGGYYGTSAVATGHLYILRTDADPARVEQAARATLPAGYLYRIESI